MKAIILSAGKGTRMKSNISKLMHKVNGIPMIEKVNNILSSANIEKKVYILGYLKETILEYFDNNIEWIHQDEQLGTAHAIMIAKDNILKDDEDIFVCNGDGPLIKSETIIEMKNIFKEKNLDCLVLSCKLDNPYGYGRLLFENNKLIDIVEEKETTEEQKNINIVNAGVYIFKRKILLEILDKFDNNNIKGEYYLTDAIKLINDINGKVDTYTIYDKSEMEGVNSKEQLAYASKILRNRKNNQLMEDGVVLIDPDNTYIEEYVNIGKETVIYPNVYIQGNTNIGEDCIIYSNTRIVNSNIYNNVNIDSSLIEESIIEEGTSIGPFAHLRPYSHLKKNVHIGNFVEIKKSILSDGVKCGHLTYIGDTEIGKHTNIGAGTITCNYDGIKKHKSIIGEESFIGSNSIIVSPVNIGNKAFTAAGSVITKDVPDNSIAFGRSKQINKNDWNK